MSLADEKGGSAGIYTSDFVMVLCADRRQFDRLNRPVSDYGPKPDGSHCITKTVEQDGVRVVIQFWLVEPPL